jgi:phosphate transport system substrate-binding protein
LTDRISLGKRLLRARYWLYALAVVALLVFRLIPSLRSRAAGPLSLRASASTGLTISGLDTAPELIPKLVSFYQALYPKLRLETRPGGTIRAVEDLLNRRADVAFLSRPLAAAEDSVVRAVHDSLLIFPVALSGTLVLANRAAAIDSLSVGALRRVLAGGRPDRFGLAGSGPVRVFVPDPALGLWGAVTEQLGIPDVAAANVGWVADDRAVARAVAGDAGALGLVSSLALDSTGAPGCRAVRVTAEPGTAAATPSGDAISGGDYPLYHRLYVACHARDGAAAFGFVSYMYGEQGQALVRQVGFLPAREIAREIQLAQRPVGMAR